MDENRLKELSGIISEAMSDEQFGKEANDAVDKFIDMVKKSGKKYGWKVGGKRKMKDEIWVEILFKMSDGMWYNVEVKFPVEAD